MIVSVAQLALAFGVVAAGATVQRTVGFGAAMVSVPLLLLIDPQLVPGPVVTANLALIVMMSIGTGHHADQRGVRWLVTGLLPGTLLAAVALSLATRDALTVLAAVIVLAAVGGFLLVGNIPLRRRTLLVGGTLSAFMGTTAGVGGPAMALLYGSHPGDTVRATLSRVFVVNWVLTMTTLTLTGTIGVAQVATGLALMPGSICGVLAGRRVAQRVEPSQLRVAVLVVAATSALAAIARVLV